MTSPFQQFLDLGWKLCRIEPGTKGPRQTGWNRKENALTSLDGVVGAGLMHAYSGTCAIDIDDWDKAETYLRAHGIELKALFDDPWAVTVSSGTEGRGKLLYRLETPLRTIKLADGKLEFRCATAEGATVQDVLPPSVHPSGRTYTMKGEPALMAKIPDKLLALWLENVSIPAQEHLSEKQGISSDSSRSGRLERMKKVIENWNPDMPHDDWLKVGMALHHESGGSAEGLELWDEWSNKGVKYLGREHVAQRYYSFGRSERPVTGDYILHQEVADISDFDVITDSVSFDGPKKTNPFIGKFYTLSQFGDLPQPDWIIKHKLPKQGLGSLYAPWGAGKSFVALDVGLSVSTGAPWRGLPVKPGPVAYVAPEDVFGIRARLSAAAHARGLSDANLHVFGEALKLQTKQYRQWLTEALQTIGKFSLVFVDTMTAACPGLDENSNKELGLLMDETRRMQEELDCMIMFLHHTGKDATRGTRGGTAFPAALDAMWEIETDGKSRELVMAKIKNGPDRDNHGNQFKYGFQLVRAEESCIVEWL